MSKDLSDFIDPDFWDWYRDNAPSWLIDERFDILCEMFDAYEDGYTAVKKFKYDQDIYNVKEVVTMKPGRPFFFNGTNEEFMEFIDVLNKVIAPFKPANSQNPISNTEIEIMRQKLSKFKIRRKYDKDNQS